MRAESDAMPAARNAARNAAENTAENTAEDAAKAERARRRLDELDEACAEMVRRRAHPRLIRNLRVIYHAERRQQGLESLYAL